VGFVALFVARGVFKYIHERMYVLSGFPRKRSMVLGFIPFSNNAIGSHTHKSVYNLNSQHLSISGIESGTTMLSSPSNITHTSLEESTRIIQQAYDARYERITKQIEQNGVIDRNQNGRHTTTTNLNMSENQWLLPNSSSTRAAATLTRTAP
jgi:hypothetical protein